MPGGLFEANIIAGFSVNQPVFIGREMEIVDTTDQIKSLNTQKQDELVTALKLQIESQLPLDTTIDECGRKATEFYSKRAFLRNLGNKRTLSMIEYNQHDVIAESSHAGLSLQKPIYSSAQKHEARSRISDCLIQDKWISEGITLKEKSIEENQNQIQHYFENELTIL